MQLYDKNSKKLFIKNIAYYHQILRNDIIFSIMFGYDLKKFIKTILKLFETTMFFNYFNFY